MSEPINMLLLEIEGECARLPGAVLAKVAGGEARLGRLNDLLGRAAPAGYARLFRAYDGGWLPANPLSAGSGAGRQAVNGVRSGLRLLSLDEVCRWASEPERPAEIRDCGSGGTGLRLFAWISRGSERASVRG